MECGTTNIKYVTKIKVETNVLVNSIYVKNFGNVDAFTSEVSKLKISQEKKDKFVRLANENYIPAAQKHFQFKKPEDLGYQPGQKILDFLGEAVAEQKPIGKISPIAAAFHRPLSEGSKLYQQARKEGWHQQAKDILQSTLASPNYSCHDIAAKARSMLGTGPDQVFGGTGQSNREKAIDAAIEALERGVPCVISLKSVTPTDDGHSFTLVLREDGFVDTLEGWGMGVHGIADITTGKKNNLDKQEVIKALKQIRLDPTDINNDKDRTQGYKVISQAYSDSKMYHHMGVNEAANKFGLPRMDWLVSLPRLDEIQSKMKNPVAVPKEFILQGADAKLYAQVFIENDSICTIFNGNVFNLELAIKDVNVPKENFSANLEEHERLCVIGNQVSIVWVDGQIIENGDVIERSDDKIEISTSIRLLKPAKKIKEDLAENLSEELRIYTKYYT